MKIVGGRYRDADELRELGIGAVGSNVMVHETAILVDSERIKLGSNAASTRSAYSAQPADTSPSAVTSTSHLIRA